jgi:hypothetical protein
VWLCVFLDLNTEECAELAAGGTLTEPTAQTIHEANAAPLSSSQRSNLDPPSPFMHTHTFAEWQVASGEVSEGLAAVSKQSEQGPAKHQKRTDPKSRFHS